MKNRAKKILIVDDVAMFREIESLFLARAGHVFTAGSGREGIGLAQRLRPDIILLDLHMPHMDGEAVCRAVRADPELGHTPVIILTSSDDPADRARALRAGADDVLPKPVNRMALNESVQRFLRFAGVRGLPRVPYRADVQVHAGSTDWAARARNLSRGGIFVEAEKELAPRSEVRLAFRLPDERPVAPTAEVVWLERDDGGGTLGMGLRFLGLDGRVARWLDDYIHERTALPRPQVRTST